MRDIRAGRVKKLCERFGEQVFKDELIKQGASPSIVNAWIRKDRTPSAEGVIQICKAFPSVSADWLLGLRDIPSKNPDIVMIHKHIGLSDKSIKALNYMTTLCKETPIRYHRKAAEAISFLDRVLEDEWTKIDKKMKLRKKRFPGNIEQEHALVSNIDFFFSLLEEYVVGSGKTGYYTFKRNEDEVFATSIPTDEIFRNVLHDEIEEYLETMCEKIGTVKIISHKMGALQWIRKRYYDKMESDGVFTIDDFNAAIAEYVEDANSIEDAEIEPEMLSLDFEKLSDYLKEVESWHQQD